MTNIDKLAVIYQAIDHFGKAYKALDDLQIKEKNNKERLLPIGDQKIGVIGEFYALLYIKQLYIDDQVVLCDNHSQKACDIIITSKEGVKKYISVKTVSEYSKTRRTSRVIQDISENDKINELHVLSLNKELKVINYWIVTDFNNLSNSITLPKSSGSYHSILGKSRIEEFKKLVESIK